MIGWLAAGLAGVVAVWPWLQEARRQPIEAIRNRAPGQFANLSRGQTHYRWSGPDTGDVVVLIHGLTTPSFVWNSLTPLLTARGYRVLSYDHYGRGFSDRPHGAQTEAFFTSHLAELLADQGIDKPVTLIGYSMGGAIAAAFAARYPDKVRRAVLIAPAGMGHNLGFTAKLTQILPVIGDWMFLQFYPGAHRKGCEAERAGGVSTVENIVDLQLAEQETRGFFRSVLSSLRGILAQVLEPQHRALAAAKLPVLAIWGSDDTVIPISRKAVLAAWNPDVTHVVITGAGHGVTYTHTDQVAAAILDWM